jgi:hypothetical protein
MESRGTTGMTISGKETLKRLLGQVPFTAELYWLVRQNGKPIQSRFSLKHLQEAIPGMVEQAIALKQSAPHGGKNVFIFATLHYWIEHAALLATALSAQGHQVTLGFLPYSDWQTDINSFDLRRQNIYAKRVLDMLSPVFQNFSFLNHRNTYKPLNEAIIDIVKLVSDYDAQYTMQVEEVDTNSPIYRMRFERNQAAAQIALSWLQSNKPDVVIVPNGTIQELGVVYRVARSLKIPTITYEFGDQRQRIWLSQNSEVMRQETDGLWQVTQARKLTQTQLDRLRSMLSSRQRGALWENFARMWQDSPKMGGEAMRKNLGLDNRPVVLLATNVLGDSLTLGRQVFSKHMEDWISRTVQYFAGRPDIQFVIRVHPGEVLTHGLSMETVVKRVLPRLPQHIRLVGARDKVNTYDLIEVADLGLVYTTTVGLEMAMSGLPVIVAGKTHYRGKGFTLDADSWVSYFKLLGQLLEKPQVFQLTRPQVEDAWNYAYRFFFNFALPFPWHLVKVWEDYKSRTLSDVLSTEGLALYGRTFRYLVGEPIDWEWVSDERDIH